MSLDFQTIQQAWASPSMGFAYRIQITASGLDLRVCSSGTRILTSDDQQYQPHLVVPPDTVSDSAGLTRVSFRVKNNTHWINHSDSSTYQSLSAILRAHEFTNASVVITPQSSTQGAVATRETVNAVIVQVTNVTAAGVTFHVEHRADLEQRYAPSITLEPSNYDETERLQVPLYGEGAAYPMPFGEFLPYLPPELYGNMAAGAIQSQVLKAGIRPKGVPALQVAKKGDIRAFVYAEDGPNGTGIEPPIGQSQDTYAYVSQLDHHARAWESNVDGRANITYANLSLEHNGYHFDIRRAPYFQTVVWGSEFLEDDSTGVTDGERALDGKSDTYAILDYSSDTDHGAVYELPSVQEVGRIIHQSTSIGGQPNDFEPTGSPVGISAFALIGKVSGEVEPTGSNNFRISIRFPDTLNYLFNTLGRHTFGVSAGISEMAVWNLPVGRASDGVMGIQNSGWGLTKFERWDFSSVAKTTGGPDDALTNPASSSGTDKAGQFRLHFSNVSSNQQPVAIIKVGLLISYRRPFEIESLNSLPNIRKKVVDADVGGRGGVTEGYVSSHPRSHLEQFLDFYRRRQSPPDSPYLDTLMVSTTGYRDNGSGDYSGTASAVLKNPLSFCHYLLDNADYGDQASFATSGLGAWDNARAALDQWSDWANTTGTSNFEAQVFLTEQRNIRDAVDRVLGQCGQDPGQVVKGDGGEWRAHVWIPSEDYFVKWNGGNPLHPQMMMQGGDSGLDLEFSSSDMRDVINHLVIRYDLDHATGKYMRLAFCNDTDSDDGYGNPWPATPVGGTTAPALCQWSQDKFGERKVEINLPGIVDPAAAVAVGIQKLWRFYRTIPLGRMTTRLDTIALENWNVFRFHNDLETHYGYERPFEHGSDWDDNWFRVSRAETRTDGIAARVFEFEWYPTVIGSEVSGAQEGGAGGISGGFAGRPGAPIGVAPERDGAQ